MKSFYDVEEVYQKLLKPYARGDIFISFIKQEHFSSVAVKLKKLKELDIQKEYNSIQASIKKLENSSLPLVYASFHFKLLGKQRLPIQVVFDELQSYLQAIKKEDEYQRFVKTYKEIIALYPNLKYLFLKKPFKVLEFEAVWEPILHVLTYILNNPAPNIYIRELGLENIDTKFVEKYKRIIDTLASALKEVEPLRSLANNSFEKKYGFKYQEPQIRFRLLDEKLFIHGLSDLTVTYSEFKNLDIACKKVFIVENKITTLSFPPIQDAIVIFGQGYGVSILKNIDWLSKRVIYYWGDIDLDGFAILSRLRGYYPQTQSLMMDASTMQKFYTLKVQALHTSKEKNLEHLTDKERNLYQKIINEFGESFRIEQERIPFSYVKSQIYLKISLNKS